MKPEELIIRALMSKKQTLSVAESCTGGMMANKLTNISGSSNVFMLGVIAYSNEAKQKLLRVPSFFIKKHGAVSEQVAIEMARGIRKIHNTDYALSVTGIAGPTGGTKTKPIGLVYIAINTLNETLCLKCRFNGSRKQIKEQTTKQSFLLLSQFL